MIRVVIYIAALALLSAAAAWLADRPGAVRLHWQGYLVESSVAALVAAVVVLAAALAAAYHLLRWLWSAPRRIRAARAARRRRRGYGALTRGMVAVAAGDAATAKRAARDADALLGEPPLALLLKAQAAQLDGDETAAAVAFRLMLEERDTEFLGLRGLLVQAVRRGDEATALALARRAFKINPRADWVLTNLVNLEIAAGNWQEAGRSVDAAVEAHRLDRAEARRRRAVLLYQRALDAERAGRADEALDLARKALDRRPELTPACVLAARLLTKAGKRVRASKLIVRCWSAAPHPELARALLEAAAAADPLDRIKALEPLVEARPDDVESHIAVAEAALDAQLWGTAREHLGQAAQRGASARLCRLMARLEEAESGDAAAARRWLLEANDAPPDPAWVCTDCAAAAPRWAIRCAECGSFDSLEWRTPSPRALAGATSAVPLAAADAGARRDAIA